MWDAKPLSSTQFIVGLSTGEVLHILADDYTSINGVVTFIDDNSGVDVAIVFNPTYIALPDRVHY